MNNKGFAVAGIIYALLVLFLLVLMINIGIISNRKTVLNKISRTAQKEIIERLRDFVPSGS